MQFTPVNLQVQGYVEFMISLVGDVMNAIGSHFLVTAADPVAAERFTTGVFGTDSGLFYWMNDKALYATTELQGADLGNLLASIISSIVGAL